ncbi:MAG TPA: beta-ketoacyl-[acyl-carrier-protein] synthase II [Pseudonocardiaceae bacterium]|jgi:3-oxoacyl-[acyl-carrier-protein] synthase II|nr:beta-ketoacyl-[acyl-carrier-protein] synthase II [Pseudonocardiaceae bacterium]
MSGNDVVVTGMGATTPLGGDVASTWDGLLAGRSGARKLDFDWVERFDMPVKFAAPLVVEPTEILPRVEARRLDRAEQVAIVAAQQAWEDAKLGEAEADPDRLAVIVGTGIGGVHTLLNQDDLLEQSGMRKVSPLTVPMLMPNGPAAHVGLAFKARAGVHAPVSACASGAEAIGWAWRMITTGEADVVIAGGAEACIVPITMAGFTQARTMSTRNDDPEHASRPWDTARDGFVLGEGAGMLILERAEHAAARGARVYARVAGVGTSSDAYHITAPDPAATGQARAIAAAVRTSGLAATEFGHVNAHATSTPVGDVPETLAIRKSVGEHAILTAPKGSLGHLLGASGAVESIATVLSLYEGVIPPTANLVNLDPDVPLDVVYGEPRKVKLTAAINDSFGFGGHNVALAFAAV